MPSICANISTEETWKDVPGYEGLYSVSNQGQIRSHDRLIDRTAQQKGIYTLAGRILKLREDADGYLLVDLNAGHDRKTFKVHRVVAEAFLPNPSNLPHVDHRNGERSDNAVSNLKWSSVKENLLTKHNIVQASGFRGVRQHRNGKYQAYCNSHARNNRFVHIGLFNSAEAASAARQAFINGRADVSTR